MTPLEPPHTSLRRAELLEALIVALTSTDQEKLPITTRAPNDPTIALLDAWATVGDVLGFYLDRIADEGYLTSATEPGSILALGGLIGYEPLPGLAAKVYLAYTLGPDPADNAVQFSPGLLFQSVPGAGEQAQTFESTDAVIARPSWNLLAPRSSQPVAADATALVLAGTTANLAANTRMLLDRSDASAPAPVIVAAAAVDHVAQTTTVELQTPGVPARHAVEKPPAPPPASVTGLIDGLLGSLAKPPNPVPESVNVLPRTARSVFAAGSDAVPRLLSELRPEVGATLYAALGTSAIGTAAVTGASALRVKAAPFGASAPPQPVFDANGRPAGTEEWPIAGAFTLRLTVTTGDFEILLGRALGGSSPGPSAPSVKRATDTEEPEDPIIDVVCDDGSASSEATIDAGGSATWTAELKPFGSVTIKPSAGTLTYAGSTDPATNPLDVTATIDASTLTVTLVFGGSETLVWDLNVRAPFTAQLGDARLSIAWTTPSAGEPILTFALQTPLPLEDFRALELDGVYDAILPGSWLVIDNPSPPPATTLDYPLVRQVAAVDTVAATGYGITAKATRLTLHDDWLDSHFTLLSALRSVAVYAGQEPLTLKPAPLTAPVTGQSIDLETVVAGMAPGRLIAVTGTRTDLPGGAQVPAGEIAMVASVAASADPGETTYSTLNLARGLAYSYQRDTVQIYGNVVSAHQGATITEMLGSGQPAQAPQTFTLSSGPLLADPAASALGYQSSLTITVDGVGYAQASRFDEQTPTRSFLTGTDSTGKTTITFPRPLPAGNGNVVASYRVGSGGEGNVRAGQVSTLLSRPAGLSAVTNPLPGTGGSTGADQTSVRAGIPAGLSALGRIVAVSDYASVASSYAGVGKASALPATIDGAPGVLVTIAGVDLVPVPSDSALLTGIAGAIGAVADPTVPVAVEPAILFVIALTASVVHDPLVSWDATVAAVTASLIASLGYPQRALGQDVAVSDLIAAAHAVPAVLSFRVTGLALVPATATASDLSDRLAALLAAPVPEVCTLSDALAEWKIAGAPTPAAVAYISATAPDTLILSEQSP